MNLDRSKSVLRRYWAIIGVAFAVLFVSYILSFKLMIRWSRISHYVVSDGNPSPMFIFRFSDNEPVNELSYIAFYPIHSWMYRSHRMSVYYDVVDDAEGADLCSLWSKKGGYFFYDVYRIESFRPALRGGSGGTPVEAPQPDEK